MAPTTRFRTFPKATAVIALDTPGERIGVIASESTVDDGGSNQLDLGIIDISGGTANSVVEHMLWDVTADDGNTLVEDFGVWSLVAQEGWDQAGTLNKVQPLIFCYNAGSRNYFLTVRPVHHTVIIKYPFFPKRKEINWNR